MKIEGSNLKLNDPETKHAKPSKPVKKRMKDLKPLAKKSQGFMHKKKKLEEVPMNFMQIDLHLII